MPLTASTAADETIELLRTSATPFITRHANVTPNARQTTPELLWSEMADLGWHALLLPESLGGSALNLRAAAALTRMFGQALLPATYIANTIIPAALLTALHAHRGTDERLRELALDLTTARRCLTLAWQENIGEIEPPPPRTRLTQGRLSGRKQFVPTPVGAGVMLVTATLHDETSGDGEPVLVAVDADQPGVTMEVHVAEGLSVASVNYANTPIRYGRPLLEGQAVLHVVRAALDAGRITLAAQLEGIAVAALERTLQYVNQRIQFARPIGSFQTIQHRCVDLHTAILLARATWQHAAQVHQACSAASAIARATSAAKARCGDTATLAGRAAIQMHGALGFTEEAGVGRYLRAALLGASWLGTSSMHRRRFMAHGTSDAADFA
jgi:3-oxochol-4-en-24-oyl-CoA dehydrogenase